MRWLTGLVVGVVALMLTGYLIALSATAERRRTFRFTTVGRCARAPSANMIIVRSLHRHYMQAVDEMIVGVVHEFRSKPSDAPCPSAPLDYTAEWLALRQASDSFESIRVYLGWPPADSDDVSDLTLIYES